jgi:hypothetical protein
MRRTRHAAIVVTVALAVQPIAGAADLDSPDASRPTALAPVLQEHRYRMSAAVRPLLFWIRTRNVGGARITWRGDGDGYRGYELLLGSDPRRAPRRINRWGWVREDAHPGGATMVGLMRKTEAESLDEARTTLAGEGKGGFVFKAISTRVANGEGRAENMLWRVGSDYTYRDLGELLQMLESAPPGVPRVRTARLPEDTRPGFLFAVAELVERGVAAATPPEGARRLLAGGSLPFTFNASLYDLRLRTSEWVEAATYGGRRYGRLVRMRFESFNRELGTRERFTLVCGTEGRWARVPVFIEYQPKWWFKAEGVLDETEVFP